MLLYGTYISSVLLFLLYIASVVEKRIEITVIICQLHGDQESSIMYMPQHDSVLNENSVGLFVLPIPNLRGK